MLFRRAPDDAPLAAERVRSVLTRAAVPQPAGGWVPGPEERDGRHDDGAALPDLPQPEVVDEGEEAAAASLVGEAPPASSSAPHGEPLPPPSPAVATNPPASLLRLPAVLASGRLDPGRRGAAALVVAALLAALVTGLVVLRDRPQEVAAPEVVAGGVPLPGASSTAGGPSAPGVAAGGAAPGATAPPTEVVVAVAGKVVRPGLVRLPPGSRVDDAVRAAGGPLPGAGTGLLNLARLLVDGEQVLVGVDPPAGAPAPAPGSAVGGTAAAGGLLDLNAATVADLDGLPGIGPVLAQRIVDWRTEHGRFASVEQLREVTGIGESKYADLEAKVVVP